MFRSGVVVLALQLLVIFKMCMFVELAMSKRLEKCRAYKEQIYGEDESKCSSSIATNQTITIQQFPYIASLLYCRKNSNDKYRFLGHGTLVSSRYVLTLAFAIKPKRSAKVRLGATSITYLSESVPTDYDVEKMITHPQYKHRSAYNNVGLIKLSRKVEFSANVRPICLPDADINSSLFYQVNYKSTAKQIPEQLPLVKYEHSPIANEECDEKYQNYPVANYGITDELMCSVKLTINDSVDYTCSGEAGAPLYIDHSVVACSHVQLGIVGFSGPMCDTYFPDVGTKVFDFSNYIESIIWADGEDF